MVTRNRNPENTENTEIEEDSKMNRPDPEGKAIIEQEVAEKFPQLMGVFVVRWPDEKEETELQGSAFYNNQTVIFEWRSKRGERARSICCPSNDDTPVTVVPPTLIQQLKDTVL